MRNNSVRLLQLLFVVCLSTSFNDIVAQESLSGFEQALKATGWSVQREADGTLVLKTPEPSAAKESDTTKPENQWPRLQKELQAAGWLVEREADGSLVLVPPGDVTTAVEQTETADKATARTDTQTDTGSVVSEQTMQQMRNTGWRVTKSTDGSILLYPPGESVIKKPRPCTGTATKTDISLPVDTWNEAHGIAQAWLSSQPPYGAAVGKIRKINNIYAVSIVSENAPYFLIQQIAIRNHDGAVIVLN